MNFEKTAPQAKEELNDSWNYQALEDLKQKFGNRFAAFVWSEDWIKKFAEENNLELSQLPPPVDGLDTLCRFIIAKKEITGDVLQERIEAASKEFSKEVNGFSEKIKILYERVKKMPLVETVKLLVGWPCLKGGLEQPEVAIIEGLIFGYKICDIDYYLRTRYLEKKKHPYEDLGAEKAGLVVCEKCAEKIRMEAEKEETLNHSKA